MKVLIIHNFYGSGTPSGENEVVQREMKLLQDQDHEVLEFTASSDSVRRLGAFGKLLAAISVIWNPIQYFRLKRVLWEHSPDVVHVHNTFPLISNFIFLALAKYPTVASIHNYRYFCAAGVPLRSGKSCTICIDHQTPFPALQYKCYRNSLLATLPLYLSIKLNRFQNFWANQSIKFICLTDFQAKKIQVSGIDASRIYIKPNFSNINRGLTVSGNNRDSVVYVGRLSHEKGVDTLIKAWLLWGENAPVLKIIGSGAESEYLKKLAEGSERITFIGSVSQDQVQSHMRNSAILVAPSRCLETFSNVIIEAMACGTAIAVSNIGHLPKFAIETKGVVFNVDDEDHLMISVKKLFENKHDLFVAQESARRVFEDKYSEQKNYEKLEEIYIDLIQGHK